jgi:hypothetical protein
VKSPEGEELDTVLKELDNLETDSARIIREITAEQKYELGMAYQHRFRGGANAALIEVEYLPRRPRTRTGMKELTDEDLLEEKGRIYALMV